MDTRATFGNNPYMRMSRQPKARAVRGAGRRGRGRRVRLAAAMRCRKNLFVYDEGLRSSEVQTAVDSIGGPAGREGEGVMEAHHTVLVSQAGVTGAALIFMHSGIFGWVYFCSC